jgi:hypothetical protein
VTPFLLRLIACACLKAAERARSGSSRERQGHDASMMLEYEAARIEGTLCKP